MHLSPRALTARRRTRLWAGGVLSGLLVASTSLGVLPAAAHVQRSSSEPVTDIELPRTPSARLIDRAYITAQGGGLAILNVHADGKITRHAPRFNLAPGAFGPVMSPDRRHLYYAPGEGLGVHPASAGQRGQIVTLRVRNDGTVAQLGRPLLLRSGLTPVVGAISKDGKNLYWGVGKGQAGMTDGALMRFKVRKDGRPVRTGKPVPLPLRLDGIAQPAISPDGRHLYVLSYLTASILRYGIRPDGSLSRLIDRTSAAGSAPINPTFSPNGKFFYLANEMNNALNGYRVRPDGSLSMIPGMPVITGSIPHNFAFSENGKFVYSANTAGDLSPAGLLTQEGSISAFRVKKNGAFVHLPGSPFPTKPGAMQPNLSSNGKWLYLTSSLLFGSSDLDVRFTAYRIQKDGTLDVSRRHTFNTGLESADGPLTVTIPTSGP